MATNNRWAARKGGTFVARDALSFEQQQILAAVPRWKKEWVRPSNLQPGQNQNYKILKWVIDTSADKSEATAEEMEAAVEQVTAGNVPNVDGTVSSDTPAPTSAPIDTTPVPPPVTAATAAVPNANLASTTEPLKAVMHEGSAQQGGDSSMDTVQQAVEPLENVPNPEALVDAGEETKQNDKSLMEE
ncbi:uncharacterized protein JCM15063_006178 [Sporobolomyces koalae]|uniref:uncharacterized protein n=1 Tax=Sporobolomyces koalae TaxID=500713 RepID=UPI00317269B4